MLAFRLTISVESTPDAIIQVYNKKRERMDIEIDSMYGSLVPSSGFRGYLVIANPKNGCSIIIDKPPNKEYGLFWIALIERTKSRINCRFEKKVLNAQIAGYDAAIICNTYSDDIFYMLIQNASITIPSNFIGYSDAKLLESYISESKSYVVVVPQPTTIIY
jgi:hypothetical protein